MAMTLVSTTTVGSGGAASITFTGIAGTGKDLLCVYSIRSTVNNGTIELQINGSSANLTDRWLRGTGSATSSGSGSAGYIGDAIVENAQTASTFSNGQLYISNYAGSANKSISVDTVTENNATAAGQRIQDMLWSSSSAITSVTLNSPSGNFAQYSTASLYIIS